MSKRRFYQIIIIGLWLIFFSLLAGGFVGVRFYNSNLKPVDRQQTAEQSFKIVKGESVDTIIDNLKEQGLIKNKRVFRWHLLVNNKSQSLQAGVFQLSPSQYSSTIAEIITSGVPHDLEITLFPEQHLGQIEDSLVEQGFDRLDAQRALLYEHYEDHAIAQYIEGYSFKNHSLEGYITPETFFVTQHNGNSAKDVIRASLDKFIENLDDDIIEGLKKNTGSVHGGIILASIVEKEVNPQDRAKVAQVFIKRLKEGMKLESDVTFVYAAEVEGGSASVDNPSPYNTRLHPGLPPGPISNVSLSSLQAVAFPTNTNYLYFVSGDDDITYFNETYEEHLEDVRKHCIKKCNL